MGCGGGRWSRVPWDMGGCGYPYPNPQPYPQGDWPDRRGLATDEVMRGELKKLYARGEITREQYLDAVERLDQGVFTLDDLWELRRGASAGQGPTTGQSTTGQSAAGHVGTAPGDGGAAVVTLRQKWEEVDKAGKEIGEAVESATQAAERLKKEMARLEELARLTVKSDESQARAYLEQRQAIGEQVSELEARLASLKGDFERLNVLKVRLEAKIASQEALAGEDIVSRLEKEVKDLE